MGIDEGVSALIGDIYAGAHEPAAWRRAVRGLMDRTGSRMGMISVVDVQQHGYLSSEYFGPDDARFIDGMEFYEQEFFAHDPMLQFAMRNPAAGKITLRRAVAETGLDYGDHPYVRWSRGTLRTGHTAVFYSAPREGIIVGASLHTPLAKDAHGANEIALLGMMFGHMQNALRLAVRPPDLSSHTDARLLLDRRGRIVAISPAAEAIVARGDGLLAAGSGLSALRSGESRRIAALVGAAALDRVEGVLIVPRTGGGRDYVLIVSPMPHPPGPWAALAAGVQVRIVDPDALPAPGSRKRWMAAFGLSAAEARLAEALIVAECDLRRAADLSGVTYATARSQLASIFARTDTHGQPQLVRLLTLTRG